MLPPFAFQLTQPIRVRSKAVSLCVDFALVGAAIGFIALMTQIKVLTFPVPATGQSLAVLLVGAMLGWRRGGIAAAGYLGLGLLGAPVFASTFGPAAFAGPTGGFLLSFVPAAMLAGWLAEQGWDRVFWKACLGFVLGHVVIFAIGVPWLSAYIGFEGAVAGGLTPFIPSLFLKSFIAAALMRGAWMTGDDNDRVVGDDLGAYREEPSQRTSL